MHDCLGNLILMDSVFSQMHFIKVASDISPISVLASDCCSPAKIEARWRALRD